MKKTLLALLLVLALALPLAAMAEELSASANELVSVAGIFKVAESSAAVRGDMEATPEKRVPLAIEQRTE